MSDSIQEAKRKLPLPVLMHQLGLGAHAKKRAFCPFHDDQHTSFSLYRDDRGEWRFKCHAGCGGGDEIDFLQLAEKLSKKDAIKRFLELAGVNGRAPLARERESSRVIPSPNKTNAFDWQECVNAFTNADALRLVFQRGYSGALCSWLKKNGLIGMYEGCPAFPVHDRAGNVVAAHCRAKNGKHWFYYPDGVKTRPLVIGELVDGDPVHIFESQWDAFAFRDLSGERSGIIVTRGASNGVLVANLIPQSSTVYSWAQNDSAGEKWQHDICTNAKATVKRVKIPTPHKDLNEWTKAGATSDDLLTAIVKAETVQEAAPVWSPEKLFNEIKAHITRYVVFSRPEDADVVALWVMHTWVAQLFDFTPYIYLHSPVMRCGKTQVHRVVEPLVKNPLRTCNISEAALFREIADSRPTLLWDEIDSIFGSRKASEVNENKRALLNAGYERGIRAIRMERSGGGFEKISYDPFCPKILAGIGRLPDTIVDRSIPILIHRRLKTQPCQKYRRQDRANAKPLHDALERWASDPELLKTLWDSHPQMPDSLSDRQEDIWEPLLAIADSVGGDVSELARAAADVLCNNGDDDLGYGAKQLLAIKKIVGDKDRIRSGDLIDGLWEADALPSRLMEDEKPNYKKIGHWLSKFIKSYDGKPSRQLDFDGQNARGYEAAELKEVFERYCPEIDIPSKER
jgi:Protein of unknown function (DUF3631)/CHC2 zinc finger